MNCETGANRLNLTPNFGTQGEKSGLSWTQIWTQFDGNFRPRLITKQLTSNENGFIIKERKVRNFGWVDVGQMEMVWAQYDKCLAGGNTSKQSNWVYKEK